MPYKSARQRRAMHAAAAGRGKIGISRKAAKKFVAHSEKGKPKKKGRKK